MNLHSLKPVLGSVHKRKRIGRDQGSGRGGTATAGHKGGQSRSGYKRKYGFEGGQMPLQRRVPKFGFNRPQKVEYKAINLSLLQRVIESTSATEIDRETLMRCGIIGARDRYKILAGGEILTPIRVVAHACSASAIKAIEQAGGSFAKIPQ